MVDGFSYSVSDFIQQKQQGLTKTGNQLLRNVSTYSYKKQDDLNKINHRIDSDLSVWFVETKNHINRQRRILKRVTGEVVLKKLGNLQHLQDLLTAKTRKQLFKEQERLKLSEKTVRLLNPENVLKRGFTLTLKESKIIKSVNELNVGEELTTKFSDGQIKSKITKKIENGN